MNERWINVGKCLAILAVITGHLNNILYHHNQKIGYASYFSVTLFVLLMGITSYWSFENSKNSIGEKIFKRIVKILVPYSVAVFICFITAFHSFSWIEYKNYWLNFNISGPHYFVLLYIQLLILSPVVFYCLKKFKRSRYEFIIELLFTGVVAAISSITTKYTTIANIYGGGGKLFGGSYLLCLTLGMIVGKHYRQIITSTNIIRCSVFTFIFSFGAIGLWIIISTRGLIFDEQGWFGKGINPPGVSLMLYAICIMFMILLLDRSITLINLTLCNWILNILAYIGTKTLYIFLYHQLFLDFLLCKYFSSGNIYIRVVIYYGVMIGGSIMLEKTLACIKKFVKSSYQYVSVKNGTH